ncbi:hypothetical protein LTS18_010314, partial [Coniosporium uncinatum]
IVGTPVKSVGKGAVLVGGGAVKGLGKGASFLGRGVSGFGRRRSKSGADDMANGSFADYPSADGSSTPAMAVSSPDGQTTSPMPGSPATPHVRSRSWGSHAGASPGGAEGGIANFSLVSASGFPPDTSLRAVVSMSGPKGLKEIHKSKAIKNTEGNDFAWHAESETFKANCTADTQFRVMILDHHTFSGDKELGEGVVYLNDQGSGGEQVVKVGAGTIRVRSQFTPSDAASMAPSTSTPPRKSKDVSEGHKLMRGVFGAKRESRDMYSRDGERGATPQP